MAVVSMTVCVLVFIAALPADRTELPAVQHATPTVPYHRATRLRRGPVATPAVPTSRGPAVQVPDHRARWSYRPDQHDVKIRLGNLADAIRDTAAVDHHPQDRREHPRLYPLARGPDSACAGRSRAWPLHTAVMTIDRHELIDGFGQALLEGTGALFIGAGMSLNAGLPNWTDLLRNVQSAAKVPDMSDLPLMAEYIVNNPKIGRNRLHAEILDQVAGPFPLTDAHRLISDLPVGEIWTTNYDRLLEQTYANAAVVDAEDKIQLVGSKPRTVIKMHGSVTTDQDWASPPVVTRSDYENYPIDRPRTWAVLQGSYLSRTMLFLGFSFTDPNVEVLLKLARRYGTTTGGSGPRTRHMTVLRRPDGSDPLKLRRHTLQAEDLERSGVRVHEIDDFAELEPLLTDLVRRTRPRRVFVSGSRGVPKADLVGWTGPLAIALADQVSWELTSLGGEAAWELSKQVAEIRKAESTYDPGRIRFSFRKSTSHAPAMDSRVGTAIYTDLTREQLATGLLDNCRALLAIHGAAKTGEEIQWARERGVGVIPLASSGGAAKAYWDAQDTSNLPKLGGQVVDPAVWLRLGDTSPAIATRAAMELLAQAMYDRPAALT